MRPTEHNVQVRGARRASEAGPRELSSLARTANGSQMRLASNGAVVGFRQTPETHGDPIARDPRYHGAEYRIWQCTTPHSGSQPVLRDLSVDLRARLGRDDDTLRMRQESRGPASGPRSPRASHLRASPGGTVPGCSAIVPNDIFDHDLDLECVWLALGAGLEAGCSEC
ncbi:hypothetical protein L227DRAFT_634046 [Lentinus tigrinus ALCF2SS1-6]|uniref:Uncharacterized protein n=1 Tax=Lentinus tigrinus ALCF2SS1-6 TaxID=1328759 RepID=A0A5C2RZW9_9APHY|nr:hypothetical protein L227DRAFT_634046 [Lentinus tigrinus ALCF2SS1-6]